jgi:hypothetical protein
MSYSRPLGYLCNCFWLLVPILLFNLLYSRQLPAAYQMSAFWKDIPKVISVPEDLLRTLVMMVPVFMHLRVSTLNQRFGLGLYLAGVLVYFTSWAVLIVAPQCAWSTSAIGFLAPAYTPILWLTGVGLLGDRFLFLGVLFKPWMYWTLSALFLVCHNLHTFMVYSRGI